MARVSDNTAKRYLYEHKKRKNSFYRAMGFRDPCIVENAGEAREINDRPPRRVYTP